LARIEQWIHDRFIKGEGDEICSGGDFVVKGGEIPALLVIDAVCRLEKGVLGDPDSSSQDSFSDGLLEFPQYTRPDSNEFGEVPDVLIGGNHSCLANLEIKRIFKKNF
jgi:tRNA (Guanine37-N(1)-) methyltransferase (EC 2.1.1.31)